MAQYVMADSCNPEFPETKGSLYLRSHHMHYARPTLVSGWHQSREAEPKDYDLDAIPVGKKMLSYSTYRRFGNAACDDWKTTTEEYLSQVQLKKDYEIKEVPKLVNEDNINEIHFQRSTDHPEQSNGTVLPQHSKDHGKMHLETTYRIDYTKTYEPTKYPDSPDYSSAYKKCHSQFTDTVDYRRFGRNTWQDESGIYANKQIKQMVFKPTCPITLELCATI